MPPPRPVADRDAAAPTRALGAVRTHGPRYSLVSIANVVLGQAFLAALVLTTNLEHATANAISVVVCAVPAYWVNRRWVWGKRGRSHLTKEVLPFWLFVVAGLVLSTGAVWTVQVLWPRLTGSPMPSLLTNVVNLGVFGTIWVVRFFWMDHAFHLDEP